MSSIFNALFRSVSTSSAHPLMDVGTKPTKAPTQRSPPIAEVTQPDQPIVAAHPRSSTPAHDASFTSSILSPGQGDRSYDITTSTLSEPTDILFPRGTPFIHRRRAVDPAEVDTTPMKPASTYQPSSTSRGRAIPIRNPLDPKEEVRKVELTEWRKDQLRRMPVARLIEPVIVRPIPTLHGPSSLPYARNPSGVDSTIPDETAFFGHIYGLKDEQAKSAPGDLVSDSAPRKFQTDGIQEAPPMPSIRYEPAVRVVREPYQTLGIRGKQASGFGKSAGRQDTSKVSGLDGKLHPSEILRAQMSSMKIVKPLQPIHEDTPQRSGWQGLDNERERLRSVSVATPQLIRKIVEDADTYPTSSRYIGEEDQGNLSWDGALVITPAKQGHATDDAATRALANSKADASVNWRLKTPAKSSTIRVPPNSDAKTPASDRSDDAPVMTIDTLFEKFAPSSGLSPVTIKVNTPPHVDPAVKEVSDTPLMMMKKELLRLPSPDPSIAITRSEANSSLIEEANLITLNSDPKVDENTAPRRVTRKASKAKGTPGAGKHLKRGLKGKEKENTPPVPSLKSPLGVAKTVPAANKGRSVKKA